ncbi:hypothetical protein EH223_04665 [candidate division KSB1 bacterium]|nr:hypothetical protein [candidate division KSB1 bacterium]RQW05622.1 MAG: hypothetical protein EH223_04665 [candidate division KSB1 bacterium]
MAQYNGDFSVTRAEVDFSRILRPWDGFGFNYVQVPQTLDYDVDPQEYGGLSLLTEGERQEIIELIFGKDGLKPGILKMFYDPWHQKEPGGPFDHESSTQWMRYFVREGLKKSGDRAQNMQIITTLYGPPPWATKQKFLRGRDLNPEQKYNLANYIIDWVEFLKTKEQFPVKWISLHNEGEDWMRWPADGQDGNIGHGHDYNMFWPPEQVVDFIKFMRPMLDARGLHDVGLTPGECTNWYRFSAWGYADAIADDAGALNNLGMIVSHGFYGGNYGRWFGEHRSVGIDIIRAKRPDIHAWVTSTSWSKMDANNLKEHHGNIYTAKVNGIIPWAGIQRPAKWVGGDPNPGCAINVDEEGNYTVRRGYYYYKQVCRAGQPGMGVARTMAMDSEIAVIGFSRNGTDHPDAFVIINIAANDKKVAVKVHGGANKTYAAFRTSDDEKDLYTPIGNFELDDNDVIIYKAPARSAATFYAQ